MIDIIVVSLRRLGPRQRRSSCTGAPGRAPAERIPPAGQGGAGQQIGDKVILEPLEKAPFDVAAFGGAGRRRRAGTSCPTDCPKHSVLCGRRNFVRLIRVRLDTNVVLRDQRAAAKNRRAVHRELAGRKPMPSGHRRVRARIWLRQSKRREQSRHGEIFLSAGFDRPAFAVEDARESGEIRAVLRSERSADRTLRHVYRRAGAPTLQPLDVDAREFERVPGRRPETGRDKPRGATHLARFSWKKS